VAAGVLAAAQGHLEGLPLIPSGETAAAERARLSA